MSAPAYTITLIGGGATPRRRPWMERALSVAETVARSYPAHHPAQEEK